MPSRTRWAKDAQTLKYDGAYHQEGDFSTVTGDQGDISGWFPVQPSQETDDASFSVQRASSHAYQEAENQLFEAYGASYIEAYSVALSLEFHEAKPIPDDNTGDVTGPANSHIIHAKRRADFTGHFGSGNPKR